jgi:FMN phosphatase YigB (HAD superfamily)
MQTQNTPIKPADLDSTILHSPDAVRQWKADWVDYHAATRAIEQARITKAQAIVAYENRTLSESEYHEQAVKRKQEQDAKQAERAAVEKAAALAEIDRLMGSPDIAEVMHRNEYSFLLEVIQWANRGYVMADNGFLTFGMGMYHIQMQAPPATTKKKESK